MDSQEGATQENDASADADQGQQDRPEQADPHGKDTLRPKKSITGSSSEQDTKAQMTSFKRELAIGKQTKKNLTKSIKELEEKIKKMTHQPGGRRALMAKMKEGEKDAASPTAPTPGSRAARAAAMAAGVDPGSP